MNENKTKCTTHVTNTTLKRPQGDQITASLPDRFNGFTEYKNGKLQQDE